MSLGASGVIPSLPKKETEMDQPPPSRNDRRPDRTPLPLEGFAKPPPFELFVGIDVSQEWVDAAVVDARGNLIRTAQRYDNRGPGFQKLWDETQALGAKFSAPMAYAMEASGSYHHNLLVFLLGKTDQVWSFNPLLLRKERVGQIRKMKTDALDAQMIAEFARKDGRQHPFSTIDPDQMRLRELCRVRFRLVRKASKTKQQLRRDLDILCPGLGAEFKDPASPSAVAVLKKAVQVTNLFETTVAEVEETLGPFYHDPGRRHVKAVAIQKHFEERLGNGGLEEPLTWEVRFLLHQLELFDEQVRQVEGRIAREMEKRKSLLTTVPGVGPVTAAIVEGELGDPHRFPDERAVRAFAGLDPSVRQSGKFEGDRMRISKRGSPRLRDAVYNAALPAIRVNPACQEFYDRLRAGGKHHKAALTAVAGKLLVQCWAVLRDGKSFELPEKYRAPGVTEKDEGASTKSTASLEKGKVLDPSSKFPEDQDGHSRGPDSGRKAPGRSPKPSTTHGPARKKRPGSGEVSSSGSSKKSATA